MHLALKNAAVAAIAGATLMCGSATAVGAVVPSGAPSVGDGRVVAHLPLRIRYGPTTEDWVLGGFRPGTRVRVTCKVRGEYVRGNSMWYWLSDGRGYVSARYVRNYRHIPWCR